MSANSPTNSGASSSINTIRHDAEEVASLFPALLIEAETLAHSLAVGYHGRRRAGPGETFWQHRPYTFGDAVSSIDWRQSARAADRLYIRQNEWEAAASIWLWRDPSASMTYASTQELDEKHHRATVLITALAILLSQSGERIGVLDGDTTAGGSSRLFHGRGAPSKILENLDHSKNREDVLIPSGEKIRSGNHVALVSDFLVEPEHVADAIDRFNSRGARGVLCQVLDPAEISFPFRGRTEFLDTESSSSLLFGNAGSLRANYKEKLEDHQEILQTISHKSGWPLYTHMTDAPARDALMFLADTLGEKSGSIAGVKL